MQAASFSSGAQKSKSSSSELSYSDSISFSPFSGSKLSEIAKNTQKLARLFLARYLPKISNKNEPNNSQNITKSKLKWNNRSKFTTKGVQILVPVALGVLYRLH